MKLLVFKYTTLGFQDLFDTLCQMGHTVSCVEYKPESFEHDPKLEAYLHNRFQKEIFDAVISFNYFQVVAKCCYEKGIKYIAWVWDSPLLSLYSPTLSLPTNYVFLFDKSLYEQFASSGIKTVYHLPLAVNVKRMKSLLLTKEDKQMYSSEVSFVGRLYQQKLSYDQVGGLSPYIRGYLEGIMKAQTKIYGYTLLDELLSEHIMEQITKQVEIYLGDEFTGDKRHVFSEVFLATKVTQMERTLLLDTLSKTFSVDLYTDDDVKDIANVHKKPYVDYYTEMPKVFALSKINLNITHRAIHSGIPLRVFDVLGAGGFLLTNYQSEILEYFEDGTDLVVFYNQEDLYAKIQYYLAHEEERQKIAKAGQAKVEQYHNYEYKLNTMFRVVFD